MKMLTTQTGGLLSRIAKNNEEAIEDTARLLAQATVGEGNVFFACFDELQAVTTVATLSEEPFKRGMAYDPSLKIDRADRVWIFTRSATNEELLKLAFHLDEAHIPFAVVAPENEGETELARLATTYISTGLLKGILPGEHGERIVQPHALAALFIYEAVKLIYDEMIADV